MTEKRINSGIGKRIPGVFAFVLAAIFMLELLPGKGREAALAAESGGNEKPMVIVIDPGHGGNDPGTTRTYNGTYYTERAFCDALAEACVDQLATYDNVLVYRTRVANNHISTYFRVEYAKQLDADLFLSIHINSSSYSSARGACTIIPSGNYRPELAKKCALLTEEILKKLESAGLRNRGYLTKTLEGNEHLKYADGSEGDYYEVIRRGVVYDIPSLILETAFITSDSDLAMLADPETNAKLGALIADGIASYYGLKKTGKNLKQPVQTAQTSGVTLGDVPGTLNLGSSVLLTASGGSGEGDYAFYVNNPLIAHLEGNKLIVDGSGSIKLSVTRMQGETTTPRSGGNTTVNIPAVSSGLSAEISGLYSDPGSGKGGADISVTLNNQVGTVRPRGTVTLSFKAESGSALPAMTATFGEDCRAMFRVSDIPAGVYSCTVSYAAGLYDGYEVDAPIDLKLDLSPENAPAPTEEPTPVPTAVPATSLPTQDASSGTVTDVPSEVPTVLPTADTGSNLIFGKFDRSQFLLVILIAAAVLALALAIALGRKGRKPAA